jgi:hypothetical protein
MYDFGIAYENFTHLFYLLTSARIRYRDRDIADTMDIRGSTVILKVAAFFREESGLGTGWAGKRAQFSRQRIETAYRCWKRHERPEGQIGWQNPDSTIESALG